MMDSSISYEGVSTVSFKMVGYIGLLGLRLVVISERFRFHCSLSVLQRLILLSAHVDVICDSAM
jgi:hypothetical protein